VLVTGVDGEKVVEMPNDLGLTSRDNAALAARLKKQGVEGAISLAWGPTDDAAKTPSRKQPNPTFCSTFTFG
jgi:hypothetical protein